MITFYDKYGSPIAYTEDQQNIYLFSGEPVAYIFGESIYTFYGRHMGWFIDGWIRDHIGNAVFYTEFTQGGPLKPLKRLRPLKGLKRLRPLKSIRELKPLKPIKTFNWSLLSGVQFFEN